MLAAQPKIVLKTTPYQAEIIRDPAKIKIAAIGRRAGKTTCQEFALFDCAMRKPGRFSWYLAKTFAKASADYMKRFGDVLDVDAFEDFAVKRGGDPWDAYNAFVGPKVQEQQTQSEAKRQQEFDEKLKLAREEGARDALSKRGLPQEVKTEPSMLRHYLDTPKEKLGDNSGREAFMQEWNKGSAA